MAYLNANIPPIYCKIRKEYLYDLKEHQGESSDQQGADAAARYVRQR